MEEQESLLIEIKEKLANCPNLSYKEIAIAAEEAKCSDIALSLLKDEESIKDQVPILLSMNQFQVALSIGVSNCELDMVYGILSNMRTHGMNAAAMVEECLGVEGSIQYLLSYAHEHSNLNPGDDLMSEIYDYMVDRKDSQGAKKLIMSGTKELEEHDTLANILNLKDNDEALKVMSQFLTKTPKNEFTRIKPATESYYNFLTYKIKDMKDKGLELDPISESIEGSFEFILHYAEKHGISSIDGLVKKLKIENKYVHMLKLRVLAKVNDWEEFQKLIKKEKPKLLPQYYADLCIEFGNKELAIHYIFLVPNLDEKIDIFMEIE